MGISLDNNKEWALKFSPLDNDYHQIIYTPNWNECTFDQEYWEVVFVDHAPALQRKEDIKRLVDKCTLTYSSWLKPGDSKLQTAIANSGNA